MADGANNGVDNQQQAKEQEPEPTDWESKYKAAMAHSREWEKRAKENQGAADELEKLKADNLSELEKAKSEAQKAKDEAAKLKATQERNEAISKVADAHKVPVEFVSMLSGANEDELTEQVKRALEVLPAYPTRTDDGGGKNAAKTKSKADRFFECLTGESD